MPAFFLKTPPAIRTLAAVLSLLAVIGSAQAQFPQGGSGGGGRHGGGPRGDRAEGKGPAHGSPEAGERQAPERLRVWFDRLQQLRPTLALQPAQDEAFDALLRDLRDLAELNERRRMRAMGFNRPPVSAVADIDHELKLEQEALADHAAAYGDVRRFHQRLQGLLSATQYEAVLDSYRKSLQPPAGDAASPSDAPRDAGKARP